MRCPVPAARRGHGIAAHPEASGHRVPRIPGEVKPTQTDRTPRAPPIQSIMKNTFLKSTFIAALLAFAASSHATEAASPFAYTIRLTLSAKAEELLRNRGETVVIWAHHYGLPNKEALSKPSLLDEIGQVPLGTEQMELKTERSVTLNGRELKLDRLKFVDQEDVRVFINVFSGRRKVKDNLLDCGSFDDSLKNRPPGAVEISCKLIGE